MPAHVILASIITGWRDDVVGATIFGKFHSHATAACTSQMNKDELMLMGYDHGKTTSAILNLWYLMMTKPAYQINSK